MEAVQQTQFDKALAVFGSINGMAEKVGVKYVSCYAWYMRGGKIPKKHHNAVLQASEGKLTAQDLE